MAELPEKAWPLLRRLVPPGTSLLVATSGGPDSQALLDVIATLASRLGLRAVYAAGVHHGLRPEADGELDLAEALARRHGVSFARLRVQVEPHGNLLDNARRVRYAALLGHADVVGAERIAVAHTANDQAETVLFHLTRGTGLAGAAGMKPRRGRIVRPLLACTRDDVLAHLEAHAIAFARDPSNDDPRRTRARLRASVLPALGSLNARAVENIARFARRARRDQGVLEGLARRRLLARLGPDRSLPAHAARGPLGERTVAAWLAAELGLTSSHDVARVRALRRAGARVTVANRIVVLDRDHYRVMPEAYGYCLALAVPGETSAPGLGCVLRGRIEAAGADVRASSTARVAFDADRLHLPMDIRPVRPGDRMQPFGLEGHIKVGDLFTNAKVPLTSRASWPLLIHGDEIAWVVGVRRGALAPVTPDTKRVLVVEVDGALPSSAC
jgi:tRNA(Ile)-lysidine synthase